MLVFHWTLILSKCSAAATLSVAEGKSILIYIMSSANLMSEPTILMWPGIRFSISFLFSALFLSSVFSIGIKILCLVVYWISVQSSVSSSRSSSFGFGWFGYSGIACKLELLLLEVDAFGVTSRVMVM